MWKEVELLPDAAKDSLGWVLQRTEGAHCSESLELLEER